MKNYISVFMCSKNFLEENNKFNNPFIDPKLELYINKTRNFELFEVFLTNNL